VNEISAPTFQSRLAFAKQNIWNRLTWFDRTMLFALATTLPLELWAARLVHLTGVSEYFGLVCFMLPWLMMINAYCRCRTVSLQSRWVTKAMAMVEIAIAAFLGKAMLFPLPEIIARTVGPLQDTMLAGWDERLHVSTVQIVQWSRSLPAFDLMGRISYMAMVPLILAALFVPPCFERADVSRRFIVRLILGALLTLAVFALCPASGPWTVEHYQPLPEQAAVSAHLLECSPSAAPVAMGNVALVSFPSFHVIGAMLAAAALTSFRRLRVVAWAVAALVAVSTVTTGWHYGVDVLGGIAIATVTIYAIRPVQVRVHAMTALETEVS
jgi:membrane-associated phospholipid phosphatase